MKENIKDTKFVENGMVIILLFIVIIILLPLLTTLISKAFNTSAKTNTEELIEFTKNVYTTINLTEEINLPFKIVFDNGKYTVYTKNTEYKLNEKTKKMNKAKLPSSGSILIKEDGEVVIENVKFGLYKCNQTKQNKVVCNK